MRKYKGKSNVTGEFIEKYLHEKNMSKENLCTQLQLEGINIDRWHLYKILKGNVILKDFELLIICKILDIDLNDLKNIVK